MIKSSDIQHYAQTKPGMWVAFGLATLFSVMILYQLTSFVLFLTRPTTLSKASQATQGLGLYKNNHINLSELHLFGIYEAKQLDPNDLPQSMLNLHLDGVFVAVPGKFSQAVISVPGSKQTLYYVGDRIPGDAKLYRILPNSVIIEKNGQLETLLLQERKLKFSPLPRGLNLRN